MDNVNKITMIITMAGEGSRFRRAGYNVPKFMIEAKGKTLFDWSMESLLGYNEFVDKYIFIARKEDNCKEFVMKNCKKYGINNIEFVELEKITDGQATTCMLALPYCSEENPILIYNIDTYVESNILKFSDISGDGYIPCFSAEGNHWSFVKLDNNGRAIEVREKVRISDNCTLGAYYFKSAQLYSDLYKEYYNSDRNMEFNEKYIAPLYNLMIERGMDVRISNVKSNKVHVLGTPEELEIFINR